MTPQSVTTLHSTFCLPATASATVRPHRRVKWQPKHQPEASVELIPDLNDKALLRQPENPEPRTEGFDEMGLLTQYIGLPSDSTRKPDLATTATNQVAREIESFKQIYLEEMEQSKTARTNSYNENI